jgi:hypothetical protein
MIRDAYQASIEAAAALSVSETDALDDRPWFADRPDRRFRARAGSGGLWVIRKVPQSAGTDVLLRTFSRTIAAPSRDNDGEIAGLWYMAAYPDWPPEKVLKRARKALKKVRRP